MEGIAGYVLSQMAGDGPGIRIKPSAGSEADDYPDGFAFIKLLR